MTRNWVTIRENGSRLAIDMHQKSKGQPVKCKEQVLLQEQLLMTSLNKQNSDFNLQNA